MTCCVSLHAPRISSAADDVNQAPLTIDPANTVIVDATDISGQTLQYYLIRALVSDEAAEPYVRDAKVDRTASPSFPILRDSKSLEVPAGKTILAVGHTRFLDAADRERLEKSPGSILLKRQGNVIVIAGSSNTGATGTFTAVSEFLDQVAGVRLYAPSKLWHSKPKEQRLQVGKLDLFREQAFVTSFFAPYWKDNDEWLRMNQNGNRMTVQTFHNLANIFPPEKFGQSHPHIYELRGGERRIPLSIGTKIWQPCLSAADLPDLAMQYIREQKKQRPHSTYISLGMMDIGFGCECEACQKSSKEHGSYSQLYFTFVNEVAKRVEQEFPGLFVTCYAYVNASDPPKEIEFRPNVAVKVVIKTYRMIDPQEAEAEKANIRRFSALGARWFFHDWRFAGVTPRNDLPAVAEFLRWAQANGGLGAYYEYSPEQNFYLDGAYYWILMRLTSDPSLDVAALWKQYCDDMFGDGSAAMIQFYKTFEDKQRTAHLHLRNLGDMPRQECALYSAADVAHQRRLLEDAMERTKGDPRVQERLSMVMQQFRAHELFALATHMPYKLDKEFSGQGINRDLLAWYLKDDGKLLAEAVDYYQYKRNVPPATGHLEMRLGYLPTVVANYSNGIGSLLGEIQKQATASVRAEATGKAKAEAMNLRAGEVFDANLPESPLPERVEFFRGLLKKNVYVPKAVEAVVIDGQLSDAAWKDAATLDGFSIRASILPSKHKTTGRLLRSGDKLLVGIHCEQVGPIWAQTPREVAAGTHIWRESGMEVFFGPAAAAGDRQQLAQYDINAFGAFRGFAMAADNREGVEVAVHLDEPNHRFTVEASLPLQAGKYDFREASDLTFNVVRMVYTSDSYGADELISWHPTGYGRLVFDKPAESPAANR